MKTIHKLLALGYYLLSVLVFIGRRLGNKRSIFLYLPQYLLRSVRVDVVLDGRFHFQIRDPYDILALHEIFGDEIYKPLFANLGKNTTLIDIGSYIGDSVVYASQYQEITEILAIEPHPENVKLIKIALTRNNIKKVTILPKAVASQSGEMVMYIPRNKSKTSFIKYPDTSREIQVETITLEQVLRSVGKSNVIVKCDCEGEEYEIFMDVSVKCLSKCQRYMIEYHDHTKVQKIIAKLQKSGFQTKIAKNPINDDLGLIFAYR